MLGLFAYVTYMEREAASAFFGAFLIWTLIAAVRGCRQKTNSWTRHLTVVLAHGGAVAISHLLMKLLLGVQFSYTHQMVLGNVDSMYKIEYLIHCVIKNGLYICVALFGIPVLYWQMKRNRGGRLAEEGAAYRDWIIFLSIAFALTLFFISYGISAKEDLGKTNIRLHTRYYIPFLPSLFALVLEEIRKSPGRAARAGIAGVLIIGVSCVLLLNPNRYVAAYDSNDTWHIQDLNGVFDDLSQEKEATKEEGDEETAAWVKPLKAFFADQTAGSKEITYNHGLLLSMSAYTLLTVLIVLLTRRRKKAAFALFCCLVLAVEGYNNVMSVQRYKKVCVDYAEAEAFVELGESITELVGDENLLIVNASNTQGRKRKTETFFNFDWYSMLNKGLNKVLGPDGVIDLNTTELPVSMSQFLASKNYPMGTTFAYVMCSKDVRFNESCVEEVLYSKETGYHLYRLVDPAFLDVDYIKDYYEE